MLESVPQPKTRATFRTGCSLSKICGLRNGSDAKLLKYRALWMDCKSTYADSIPTSASTLKQLRRSMIYGAFLFSEQRQVLS